MPLRPKGKTAMRIISHRVAPRASAASSWRTGVWRKISRQIAVMIGTTITARTIAAVKIVRPVARHRAGEEREPPHVLDEPGVDRLDRGREDHDAPEAEDDRRDRREQVDDIAEGLREASGRVVRDEERDADRERHGHEEREERRPTPCRTRGARRSPRSRSASSEAVSLVAVRPGIDWMTRKIATAARVTRIMDPAARAVPENQRSPGRCLALGSEPCGRSGCRAHGVLFSVGGTGRYPARCTERTAPGIGVLPDDDQVDRRVDLLGQRVRDRRAAGGSRLRPPGPRGSRRTRRKPLTMGATPGRRTPRTRSCS